MLKIIQLLDLQPIENYYSLLRKKQRMKEQMKELKEQMKEQGFFACFWQNLKEQTGYFGLFTPATYADQRQYYVYKTRKAPLTRCFSGKLFTMKIR